jgi:pimeloyl-ACP methyl ester carboxylesterase
MPKQNTKIDKYIVPMYINGLHGRMLRMPNTKKKREILMVYGHHASLERMFGLAEVLNKYGSLTAPDLPGFGGMESFYKIGEKPTLDNMADYLATFIKLAYKRRRVTILAMSFGFLVTTRMLQKYPDLAKKVDLLVSFVGFVHHEDFKLRRRDRLLLRYTGTIFSNRLPAFIGKTFVLRAPLITMAYKLVEDKHSKLHDADAEEKKRRIAFEVYLWQCNDLRTHADTTITLFTTNLCTSQVGLPVHHI